MSSMEGGEEILVAKTYPNVGVPGKQSRFESDRELIEPYEG